jgi:hypothetical protein
MARLLTQIGRRVTNIYVDADKGSRHRSGTKSIFDQRPETTTDLGLSAKILAALGTQTRRQGDSHKPPEGYESKTLAESVRGLMNDLQIGRHFVAVSV